LFVDGLEMVNGFVKAFGQRRDINRTSPRPLRLVRNPYWNAVVGVLQHGVWKVEKGVGRGVGRGKSEGARVTAKPKDEAEQKPAIKITKPTRSRGKLSSS
jgi:hypothetical protein